MKFISETDPDLVRRLGTALRSVPRVAYAGAHVYPAAAPAFDPAPARIRPAVEHPFLRLYVHIPFCRYKCSFCYYAVKVTRDRERFERYVAALERELEWVAPGTPLSQLFVGGGTPTALPPDLLDRTLGAVFDRMPHHTDEVHVCETSPDTISPEHLEVLTRRGVGRVSMGIQSLDAPILKTVKRGHGTATALDAVHMIVASGRILNVDLIYGLPGQTEQSFKDDVARLAEAGVHALTLYDLRLNRTIPVAKQLADEEWLRIGRLMRWRQVVKEAAEAEGFTQTRWHTFKRLDGPAAGHRRAPCNTEGGYGFQLGIGLSARSHLGRTVYRNVSGFDAYLARIESGQSPVADVFELNEVDRKTQHLARSLGDGLPLDPAAYRASFGVNLKDDYGSLIDQLTSAGALEERESCFHLTEAGKLVHDLVTLAFYPQHIQQWLRDREPDELAETAS